METLIIIFDYLLVIVGIAFLATVLYAIIAGFIKGRIRDFKLKKEEKELNESIDELIAHLEEEIAKEEAEKEKKSVKKTLKKKKDE